MTSSIEVIFTYQDAELREAMQAAGNRVTKTAGSWPFRMTSILMQVCVAFGAIAMTMAGAMVLFDIHTPGLWPIIIGGVLGTGLGLLHWKLYLRLLARPVLASAFGHGEQTVHFSAQGLRNLNSVSDWQTRWEGVEAILPGKTTLAFPISGIVLYVPRDTLTDDQQDQISAWHKAARG